MIDTMKEARVMQTLINERIRNLRLSQVGVDGEPMSQADFAELVGVSRTTVSNIETDKQGAPLPTIYKIADALNLEIQEVLPSVKEVNEAIGRAGDFDKFIHDVLPEWSDEL